MTEHRPATLSGGCQCGAVRYSYNGAVGTAAICHCRMCQKAAGNWGLALVRCKVADLRWTKRPPDEFRSSTVAVRGFCRDCGTPLYIREDGDDCFEITIGSLDEPGRVEPTLQVGTEARLPWFEHIAALPHRTTETDRAMQQLDAIVSLQHPDRDT